MAVTERQRHDLLIAVEEVLDAAHAETLMNLLPPVGWADVATKHDLDLQRELLEARLDTVRTELQGDIGRLRAEVKADLETALRQQTITFVTVVAVLLGICTAIVQLTS